MYSYTVGKNNYYIKLLYQPGFLWLRSCPAKWWIFNFLWMFQVQCNDINKTYVWGVNDRMFHVEIEKPYVVYDTISDKSYCDWEMVSVNLLEPLKLDHTQFNASWMKKEFIEKVICSFTRKYLSFNVYEFTIISFVLLLWLVIYSSQ